MNPASHRQLTARPRCDDRANGRRRTRASDRQELALLRPEVRAGRNPLEALLDDDFVEIGASGRRWERDAIIADLLQSPAVEVTVANMAARIVANHVALVTYEAETNDRRVLRSSWWRESGGHWKCFFHQGTVAISAD
jgi:hypothetical protein